MSFTPAQISTIRGYIGSAPTTAELAAPAGSKFPTDADLDATAAALGTTDPHTVALHYIAQWCADLELGATSFTLPGAYSEDRADNLRALQARRAELRRLVSPTGPDPTVPRFGGTVALERDDRERLWTNAATDGYPIGT